MRMASVSWFIVFILITLPLGVFAQQWHSQIVLESKTGYATNSYLNDYLSEWEPSLSAPYWMVAPRIHVSRYFGQNAFSVDIGGYFQPYLKSDYSSWSGGFGRADFNRRLNRIFYTGIQGGFNRYYYSYSRTQAWVEPYVRWNISDDMEARLHWNNSYRSYGELQTDTSSNHYQRLALHYQWWPSFKWKIETGFYGNLDQVGGGEKALSGYFGTTYWIRNDLNVQVRGGFERYGFKTTSKRSVGPRCDVLMGCSVNNRVFISNQDDIYRLELDGQYLLNPRWTFNVSTALMRWENNRRRAPKDATDVAFSFGVTYSIVPDWGGREEIQVPTIEKTKKQTTLFKIKYRGDAKLYLTGDFNNWNRPGIPLIKGPNELYRTTLKLNDGVYEYKIMKVEGGDSEWLKLDDATAMVKDGFGGMNGRLVIE